MHKPNHVYIAVSEEYRRLREIQTFINRLVWSTELCYSYFIDVFKENKNLQKESIAEVFAELPMQAWFKNKNGTGKYNISLEEHNSIVEANQRFVFRSAIILYNSYFEEYLKSRIKSDARKSKDGEEEMSFLLFLNLTNRDIRESNLKFNLKNVIMADICRVIRNTIVHQPAETFLSINEVRMEIKKKITDKLMKKPRGYVRCLHEEYTESEKKEARDQAINEVIDNAIQEVNFAAERKVILPYEFFFMLFTFTNYNRIAAEIEQVLFEDGTEKNSFNRVSRHSVHKYMMKMIAEPSLVGIIRDSKSRSPLKNAKVEVIDNPFSAESDKKGYYYLSPNLRDGSYFIQTSADGYETRRDHINTYVGRVIKFDIDLEAI